MSYSPAIDIAVTFGFLALAAGLLLQMFLDTVFWRRCARMLRRSGMWGGE